MDVFFALAEPTRRHIIEMLAARGKLSASDISGKFQVSPPAISQHLKVLREVKLVDMEKRGQQHLYQINPQPMKELEGWIHKMTTLWDDRFNRLDKLLEKEKRKMNLLLLAFSMRRLKQYGSTGQNQNTLKSGGGQKSLRVL